MIPKVSIIVPVYNVEKTLKRCVDSILAQTYKDYEVILVDDGSSDKSSKLCDEIVAKHMNFSVIHKENEGLGPTRDRGMDAAKGQYIYHCDSDDWIDPDMLENIVNKIEEHNADVVIFGYKLFVEKQDEFEQYGRVQLPNGIFIGDNIRKLYTEQYFNSFSVQSAWNRLYRRSFLLENDIRFPELRRGQDVAYSLLLFDKMQKLVTVNNCYYNYLITPGVFKGRAFKEMIDIYKCIYDMTKNTFIKWNLYDAQVKRKLQNTICEHIANYSCYAFVVKCPQDFDLNVSLLLSDEVVHELFSKYFNWKSKFMFLFKNAVNFKSKLILKIVSRMIIKKQGFNN